MEEFELSSIIWRYYIAIIFTIVAVIMLYVRREKNGNAISAKDMTKRKSVLEACRRELEELVETKNCNPILLRLAWSDAASYDSMLTWPIAGGVNGRIRFATELSHPLNAGLSKAVELLRPIQAKYDKAVSWADLIALAGAVAVERAGGPAIVENMRFGRIDAPDHTNLEASRLPSPFGAPYPDKAISAQVHLRNVFYRMGLRNQEIVALCGAHTIGRAFKDRSGASVCTRSSGDLDATQYTHSAWIARRDGKLGIGMPGGCSWTKNWLTFDNTYFTRLVALNRGYRNQSPRTIRGSRGEPLAALGGEPESEVAAAGTAAVAAVEGHDPELLCLATDQALFDSPELRPFVLRYAESNDAFLADYASAHVKMSELGAKFEPQQGFRIGTK